MPPHKQPHKIIAFLQTVFRNWQAHQVPSLSAALAYYTSFSVAPLLLMLIAIAGLVFGQDAVQGRLFDQLQGLVGAKSAEAIQTMVAASWKPSKNVIALVISGAGVLIGAMGVLSELKNGLNRIWQTKKESGGIVEVVKERARYLGFIIGAGFLLMVSLAVSAAVAVINKKLGAWLPFPEFAEHALDGLISWGVIAVLFAMIFKYIPNAALPWKPVAFGAGVTAALFTIGKIVLGLYLGKGAVGSSYGAAGGIMIILLWVYYSGLILYTGAEITKVYAERNGQTPHK